MEDYSSSPVIPTSRGALLAEEWTINPYSVLPSFLEMIMIRDADRSTRAALQTATDTIQRHLLHRIQAASQADDTENSSSSNGGFDQHSSIWNILRRWSERVEKIAHAVLQKYSPEMRCLALYFMERRCLQSSASATLSESVYGTRRAKLIVTPGSRQGKLATLNSTDKTRLALLLTMGPYLRERLQFVVDNWQRNTVIFQQSKWRRLFVRIVYPLLMSGLDGVNLICQFRFLLGQSLFYDPTSILLSQVVRRVSQQDTATGASAAESSDKESSRSESTAAGSLAQKSILYVLSASIAFSWLTQVRADWEEYRNHRRLLQQQQATGESHAPAVIPPPPPHDNPQQAPPAGLCPLCRRQRINPTASSSGHVFCLACLLPYVKEHGKCPVTGMDCPESKIVRLYEPRPNDLRGSSH